MGRNTATRDRHRRIIKAKREPCAICHQPIDYALPYLHPMSFEVDHIIAINNGGPDTIENKAASHRRCNRDKSDKVNYDPLAAVVTVKRVRSY